MPVISIIISKYLYHPQQKTRTRTKKMTKNVFHDHEKKERKILIMSMYLKTYQSDDMIYC